MLFKKKIYLEKADYIKIKNTKTSSVSYMLNYQCFERLAMSGQTEQSEILRNYFVKFREFITEKQKTYISNSNK